MLLRLSSASSWRAFHSLRKPPDFACGCSSGEALKPIASEWLAARTPEERALLRSSGASLSPELDRSLLHCAKSILGRFLTDEEKIRLRALVRAQAESD